MRRQIGERQIGEVISRHVRIDVGHLYELGMGGVIHEFRPLSAETFKLSMSNLFKDTSQGDDFRLCLKVGADVNELAEGQTAMIRAMCANNMEAFEMILSDHPDLEVKAGKVPKGTSVRDVRKGDMVVIVACCLRRWEMVWSLIAKGANVNARGRDASRL
uniref:Uncharacterized protein n=1 Tax=Chromera velia CCMP2878 TaxID=1169474 RepID=A0A0G4F8G8_9ALVE|eukprot:Cvel_15561.t1-p1 / transcript=Cvel_15561.t1 / gene=Cvel_15561 / organism=Chromera_velia_CCMP2878 / gene_product=hypothetical protein / transcript_product=hypothetical protein / location=Cvel_scaffold1157:5279-5755(-) / protein_length=159 / sequence_SO=supercontig / SO=protein_coding / is_pseudo=false